MGSREHLIWVVAHTEHDFASVQASLTLPCVRCYQISEATDFTPAALVIVAGWGHDEEIVCAEVRRLTRLPIALITDDASTGAKVRGLQAGADVVLTRDTSGGELEARIKAAIRRYQMPSSSEAFRLLRQWLS